MGGPCSRLDGRAADDTCRQPRPRGGALPKERGVHRQGLGEQGVGDNRARPARELRDGRRACREGAGIPIVRRFTAGGTVYNGPGNMNWSLFVARGLELGDAQVRIEPARDIPEAPRGRSCPLRGLAGSRPGSTRPTGSSRAEGKISGMAAYVSRKGFLCHGTLLVGADLARVKALTTPAPRGAREEVHEEPGR